MLKSSFYLFSSLVTVDSDSRGDVETSTETSSRLLWLRFRPRSFFVSDALPLIFGFLSTVDPLTVCGGDFTSSVGLEFTSEFASMVVESSLFACSATASGLTLSRSDTRSFSFSSRKAIPTVTLGKIRLFCSRPLLRRAGCWTSSSLSLAERLLAVLWREEDREDVWSRDRKPGCGAVGTVDDGALEIVGEGVWEEEASGTSSSKLENARSMSPRHCCNISTIVS